MRHYITYIFLMTIVSGCISDTKTTAPRGNCVINTNVITSGTDGVDSLMTVKADDIDLFKIALGGNTELLSDTVIRMDGEDINVITLADYFQDDQIFYILFNPSDHATYQTEKVYLPYLGLDISRYKRLDSFLITGDSLYVSSENCPEARCALRLDSIQCNDDGILNYNEFE